MTPRDTHRFANLGFDDFRRLASDPALSKYEKIGFPDSYREGREPDIFRDIRSKLPALDRTDGIVVDIGPGCSDIPRMLISQCESNRHELHLIDSREMLSQLPDSRALIKTAAFFPECPELIQRLEGRVDAVIVYSVFHYIFVETNVWRFIDASTRLLAPGGRMLIGDIPNVSMRNRFFGSATGRRFHRDFTGRDEDPPPPSPPSFDQIDDSVMMAVVSRVRDTGLHAFIVPQDAALPLANRREDILIVRP